MLKANLTTHQHDIVRDICNLQIQSLLRVSCDNMVENQLINCGIDINKSDVSVSISNMLRVFDNLKSKPDNVFFLKKDSLSLFKHMLFHNDTRYSKGDYKKHKSGLWVKIDIAEQFSKHIIPN
jgi:hypothetical protein